MILLKNDGFELGLSPKSGGTVMHFRHHGTDLLRAAIGSAPIDAAAFPLVPFSGRIANGTFDWMGRRVQLQANFPPEPHTIHGHGWQSDWDVEEASVDRAVLSYSHPAGNWPWTYRSVQQFQLGPSGLDLMLSLKNMSNEPMPAGIGWHPYFSSAGAEIVAETTKIWDTGAHGVPTGCRVPSANEQLRRPQRVEGLALDTPFETTGGPVTLHWPARQMSLRILASDNLRFLVVYTPPGAGYFCVEPVSHIPNMVNLAFPPIETGLVALAPGETLSGTIRVELQLVGSDYSPAKAERAPAR